MNQDSKPAIEVVNVTKSFKIPLDKNRNLKQKLLHGVKGKGYREFTPLRDITFTINKGDFFGIVGRNGSGKSTLLKTIAGIYAPEKGHVKVNGMLVPFIELGVGFNPELSGRENIYLNGALLGFSRKEIDDMYEDVVEFAELQDFMEEKLRNYSSGMQVRLAFSIAIRAKGDILLLDEVLAVGDSAFQQKCFDYFALLKEQKKTVILVSHSMSSVQRFCTKAILLEEGRIAYEGTSEEVAAQYENMFIREQVKNDDKKAVQSDNNTPNDPIEILSTEIRQSNKKVAEVAALKPFSIKVTLKSKITYEAANIGFNIKNHDGIVLSAFSTVHQIGEVRLIKNETTTLSFEIDNIFTNGNYSLSMAVAELSSSIEKLVSKKRNITNFGVYGVKHHVKSLVHPTVKIEVA